MRKKTNFLVYPLLLMGVLLVFASSCEEDDDTNKSNTVINSDGKTGTVTDVEGNVYPIVRIWDQWWMAENLKTTRYNDNTAIPLVTDNTAWSNLGTPGYCWYSNDQATYGNTCGALYNWHTVNTGKLCPTGWHVPSDDEWTELTDYLGGTSVAGGKLKETGTFYWLTPNTDATNETGFTALPGGKRDDDGDFNLYGLYGYWWSATEDNEYNAWYRYMSYKSSEVIRSSWDKERGFSVRCVMD